MISCQRARRKRARRKGRSADLLWFPLCVLPSSLQTSRPQRVLTEHGLLASMLGHLDVWPPDGTYVQMAERAAGTLPAFRAGLLASHTAQGPGLLLPPTL